MKRVIAAMRGRDVTNPNHKGESSGVLEETIKVRDGTSKGFSEVPIGGGGGHGYP